MPEPTTIATATSTGLGLLGLALVGHAYAQETELESHTVVEVGQTGAGQPVGVVVDPGSITGPGGMIAVALVLKSALKGWTPSIEIKHSMDEETGRTLREGLATAREWLAVLRDRRDRE